MPERSIEHEANPQLIMRQLHEAGYQFVLSEQQANGRRFDFVAYAPDYDGELRPHAVVEVRHASRTALREQVLNRLAYARELLGTQKHYYVENGRWLLADSGLREFTQISRPEPVERHEGIVSNDSLLDQLLARMLQQAAAHPNETEQDRSGTGFTEALVLTLQRLGRTGILRLGDQEIVADRTALWHASNRLTRRVLETVGRGELFTPRHIADVMARILGEPQGTVADPFCGTGLFLAEAAERARAANAVELYGRDINSFVVDIAKELARLAPAAMSVELGDSLDGPVRSAKLIITAPPIRLRLGERYELLSGEYTADGDLAVIDCCVRMLVPDGRAVILLSRGWTLKGGVAQRYRAWLNNQYRVAALVGLPAGVLNQVNLPLLILVLENKKPSTTFVAELEADWQEQLGEDGPAMRTLQAHLSVSHDGPEVS